MLRTQCCAYSSPFAQAYEKAEDPIYVLDNNIAIDTAYYLENQVPSPARHAKPSACSNVSGVTRSLRSRWSESLVQLLITRAHSLVRCGAPVARGS